MSIGKFLDKKKDIDCGESKLLLSRFLADVSVTLFLYCTFIRAAATENNKNFVILSWLFSVTATQMKVQ